MRLYAVAGGFLRVAMANTWRSYAGAPVAVLARRLGDAALGYGVLVVDALGIDPEQDFDAVPCPRGYLGRWHPGIEPQLQAGMAEIVDPLGER